MTIRTITIDGEAGTVTITRTERGATAAVTPSAGGKYSIIARFDTDEPRDARYAKALEVAKAMYGSDRRGRVAATNSMVHDVLNEIERVAGC